MEVWYGLDNVPENLRDTVVIIGVFDGIHLGHKHLIAAVVSDARARGVKSPLMTFDPNPVMLFVPDKTPPTLSTVSRRAELAETEGTDIMLVVPLDKTFSSIPAEDFVRTAMRDRLNTQTVFVGQNFTYGQEASSATETLPEHGRKCGIDVTIVGLFDVTAADSTEHVSSTHACDSLADGAVSAATSRLGCFHRVDGDVIPSQGRGEAQLGFLTANTDFTEGLATPADGVHAAWLMVQPTAARPEPDLKGNTESGVRHPAVASVGTNVTSGDTDRTVEAYAIDHYASLYDTAGQVEFVDRIRGVEKFDSIEELIDRMSQDVADTEAILAKVN